MSGRERLARLFAHVPFAGEAVDAVAGWVQERLTTFGRSGYVVVGESDRREVPPTVALQALALALVARLFLPPEAPTPDEVLDERSALDHLDAGRIDEALAVLEHLRRTVPLVEGQPIPFERLARVMPLGARRRALHDAWREASATATGEQLLRWCRLEPWLRGLGALPFFGDVATWPREGGRD